MLAPGCTPICASVATVHDLTTRDCASAGTMPKMFAYLQLRHLNPLGSPHSIPLQALPMSPPKSPPLRCRPPLAQLLVKIGSGTERGELAPMATIQTRETLFTKAQEPAASKNSRTPLDNAGTLRKRKTSAKSNLWPHRNPHRNLHRNPQRNQRRIQRRLRPPVRNANGTTPQTIYVPTLAIHQHQRPPTHRSASAVRLTPRRKPTKKSKSMAWE